MRSLTSLHEAAPAAREIFDHQCKTAFATKSAQPGNVGRWQESPLIGGERKTSAWSEDYRV
jgi:hypothetical protein